MPFEFFIKRKVLLNQTESFVRLTAKILYPLEHVQIGLNDLKDFNINDKERSERHVVEDNKVQALFNEDSAQSTCELALHYWIIQQLFVV